MLSHKLGKCAADDEASSCSAVESIAVVSFWEELDPDLIVFLLLKFQPFVTKGMWYKTTYWGFAPFSADKTIQLAGVPAVEMPEDSKNVLEGIVKNYLSTDLSSLNVPGLKVLVVDINSVKSLASSRSRSRSLKELPASDHRLLDAYGIEVETTVAGQYRPPPEVDVGKLIDDSLDRGSREITKKLKESGDPYFEDLAIIDVQEDDDEGAGGNESEEEKRKRRSKSKVGIIFGILFLILFLVAIVITAIIFYRRRKEKDQEEEEEKILESVGTNDYGDFYSKGAGTSINDTKDDEFASMITDPTYRGGKYEDIDKKTNNASEYYDEDVFDEEEDAGTFTGQIIEEENDDISALQSVRGVEDGWTTEPSKRSLMEKTNVTLSENSRETLQTCDEDPTRSDTQYNSGYESHTSGYRSKQTGSYISSESQRYSSDDRRHSDESSSRRLSDSISRSDYEYDGYQSQGTGYTGNLSRGNSAHNFSIASAPTVNRRRMDAFSTVSQARTNISAPTVFEEEDPMILTEPISSSNVSLPDPSRRDGSTLSDPNVYCQAQAPLLQVQSNDNGRIRSPEQHNTYDDYTEAGSVISAPTILDKNRTMNNNFDDFSVISMDSFASAPTVMVERANLQNTKEGPNRQNGGIGLSKIDEGDENLASGETALNEESESNFDAEAPTKSSESQGGNATTYGSQFDALSQAGRSQSGIIQESMTDAKGYESQGGNATYISQDNASEFDAQSQAGRIQSGSIQGSNVDAKGYESQGGNAMYRSQNNVSQLDVLGQASRSQSGSIYGSNVDAKGYERNGGHSFHGTKESFRSQDNASQLDELDQTGRSQSDKASLSNIGAKGYESLGEKSAKSPEEAIKSQTNHEHGPFSDEEMQELRQTSPSQSSGIQEGTSSSIVDEKEYEYQGGRSIQSAKDATILQSTTSEYDQYNYKGTIKADGEDLLDFQSGLSIQGSTISQHKTSASYPYMDAANEEVQSFPQYNQGYESQGGRSIQSAREAKVSQDGTSEYDQYAIKGTMNAGGESLLEGGSQHKTSASYPYTDAANEEGQDPIDYDIYNNLLDSEEQFADPAQTFDDLGSDPEDRTSDYYNAFGE